MDSIIPSPLQIDNYSNKHYNIDMPSSARPILNTDKIEEAESETISNLPAVRGTEDQVRRVHKNFLEPIDRKHKMGRNMDAMYSMLVLEKGGTQNMTITELEITRRMAVVASLAAKFDSEFSNGVFDPVNLKQYLDITKTQVSLARLIGMRDVAKPQDPNDPIDLKKYMDNKYK